MARHTHDTNGRTESGGEMKIGDEIVTYDKVHCTCGEYVENRVTNRRKALSSRGPASGPVPSEEDYEHLGPLPARRTGRSRLGRVV
jgi:hypothetical protein